LALFGSWYYIAILRVQDDQGQAKLAKQQPAAAKAHAV
jgi:hypothetical protein